MVVEVICDTGKRWRTAINATYAEAVRYFVGQVFVDEHEDGTEARHRCTSIVELS